MSEEFAEFKIKDKVHKLPIKKASIGQDVIDVTKLYSQTGYFTYDPGFMSTASCTSNITYIDGDNGILRHRGYDIKELAENKNFLEVSYLLLHGELPNEIQYKDFREDIAYHALSIDMTSVEGRELAAQRMIAKMPTIAAMTYKYSLSQAFVYPLDELYFTENFLHMMFASPSKKYKVNPVLAKALDKIFILHADHEQNASTSTVRTCGSSGSNPFAAVSAGIASLWGQLTGELMKL